jgi:hypothetical protein
LYLLPLHCQLCCNFGKYGFYSPIHYIAYILIHVFFHMSYRMMNLTLICKFVGMRFYLLYILISVKTFCKLLSILCNYVFQNIHLTQWNIHNVENLLNLIVKHDQQNMIHLPLGRFQNYVLLSFFISRSLGLFLFSLIIVEIILEWIIYFFKFLLLKIMFFNLLIILILWFSLNVVVYCNTWFNPHLTYNTILLGNMFASVLMGIVTPHQNPLFILLLTMTYCFKS